MHLVGEPPSSAWLRSSNPSLPAVGWPFTVVVTLLTSHLVENQGQVWKLSSLWTLLQDCGPCWDSGSHEGHSGICSTSDTNAILG